MKQQQVDLEKVMEKIKKLLALATSDNEAEARAALEKAQELQAKYNIQYQEEDDKLECVTLLMKNDDSKSVHSYYLILASNIAEFYRCWVCKSVRSNGTFLQVMGLEKDIKIFKEVLEFAWMVLRSSSSKYVKNLPKEYSSTKKTAYKNDYMKGFCLGVRKGLKDNQERFALVVIVPKQVKEEVSKIRLRRATSSSISAGSLSALSQGIEDGRQVMNNHRKGIEGAL